MPGFTPAKAAAILDSNYPTTGAGHHVAYSINGTSEWAGMARTPIGATGWSAATVADPSVKANANALTSAAATATTSAATIYYAVATALTGGTIETDWQALTDDAGAARTFTLAVGDKLSHAVGKIAVTLT